MRGFCNAMHFKNLVESQLYNEHKIKAYAYLASPADVLDLKAILEGCVVWYGRH